MDSALQTKGRKGKDEVRIVDMTRVWAARTAGRSAGGLAGAS